MGYSIAALREIRASSIGAEVRACGDLWTMALIRSLGLIGELSPRMKGILIRYANDTRSALREVARVLRPDGRAVFVVGENTIRGVYIPTSKLLTFVAAAANLKLVDEKGRVLPPNRRYLPPPGVSRSAMDTRMRREVVLTFERERLEKTSSRKKVME